MTLSTLINRARMTVTGTPGTGTITVGAAAPGFQTFAAAGILDGQLVSYVIEDGSNWEVGQGTYTSSGTTLARTTVLASSNSGSAISATSGAIVSATALASDLQASQGQPGGRLTLASATPVMTTNVDAATSVYYTPYNGDRAPFWDGRNWVWRQFAEVSQALTDATKSPAAAAASSVYDVFLWNDAGTVRATRGPVWTSDTARSAGTALAMQNGFYVNNASITNGPAAGYGLYLGTMRTAGDAKAYFDLGSAASGGGQALLYLWNNFNRALVTANVADSGASYTYATNTWRLARASATNVAAFVLGLAEEPVTGVYFFQSQTAASAGAQARCGLGLDSATPTVGAVVLSQAASALLAQASLVYEFSPAIGYHYLSACETSSSGTTTFDNGSGNCLQLTMRM